MWNNLDSVGLSVVEFGFDASFSCSTTTNPQFNFLLCQTVCLCVCERVWKQSWLPLTYCGSFACGFPSAGVWLVPVHHSSTSASHTSPPTHKGLHQSLWKKREKRSFLLQARARSLQQPASQSEPPVWPPSLFSQSTFGAAQHSAAPQEPQNTFIF